MRRVCFTIITLFTIGYIHCETVKDKTGEMTYLLFEGELSVCETLIVWIYS